MHRLEHLRSAGVRLADLHGYSYDRRDVTGRMIANAYARTLGAIFTAEPKPFEVEICVAELGTTPERDELYRLTYDGSVTDEPGAVAMGGQPEAITTALRARHRPQMSLTEALRLAVDALASVGGEGGQPRTIPPTQLEVAILDRARPGRTFRRITGAALTPLLAAEPAAEEPAAAGVQVQGNDLDPRGRVLVLDGVDRRDDAGRVGHDAQRHLVAVVPVEEPPDVLLRLLGTGRQGPPHCGRGGSAVESQRREEQRAVVRREVPVLGTAGDEHVDGSVGGWPLRDRHDGGRGVGDARRLAVHVCAPPAEARPWPLPPGHDRAAVVPEREHDRDGDHDRGGGPVEDGQPGPGRSGSGAGSADQQGDRAAGDQRDEQQLVQRLLEVVRRVAQGGALVGPQRGGGAGGDREPHSDHPPGRAA